MGSATHKKIAERYVATLGSSSLGWHGKILNAQGREDKNGEQSACYCIINPAAGRRASSISLSLIEYYHERISEFVVQTECVFKFNPVNPMLMRVLKTLDLSIYQWQPILAKIFLKTMVRGYYYYTSLRWS